MSPTPLSMFALPDLSCVFRGKSFGAHRRDLAWKDGLVWPPANIMISPLGSLPSDSPFGPLGEIRLRAVEESSFRLPAGASTPEMDLFLADIYDIAMMNGKKRPTPKRSPQTDPVRHRQKWEQRTENGPLYSTLIDGYPGLRWEKYKSSAVNNSIFTHEVA